MRLGDIINRLEELPADFPILYDFEHAVPLAFISWRGSYDELSLEPCDAPHPQTVGTLLELAKQADGETFTGYKGGDYAMDRDTPVWADPYGDSEGRYIIEIDRGHGECTIRTAVRPSEYRW